MVCCTRSTNGALLAVDDIAQGQTATAGAFSLMAEIAERERLAALWQSRGLGINLRVAQGLRSRMLKFLEAPHAHPQPPQPPHPPPQPPAQPATLLESPVTLPLPDPNR